MLLARIAQLVEHLAVNQKVVGSKPTVSVLFVFFSLFQMYKKQTTKHAY